MFLWFSVLVVESEKYKKVNAITHSSKRRNGKSKKGVQRQVYAEKAEKRSEHGRLPFSQASFPAK
jgi:hypothetical protein